jgi:hypothetical protein
LKAWNSFYHIYKGQKITGVLAQSSTIFNTILPKWKNRNLSLTEKKDLIIAFAKSRFYNYSKLLVFISDEETKSILLNDDEIQDIVSYAGFIEAFDSINKCFYPQIARGLKNYNAAYDNAVNTIARDLWEKLFVQNLEQEYNQEALFAEIENRYGAIGYVGETVNYYCWLLGHSIIDEKRSISQYGYQAEFRYISLGQMISRDFTSWLGATNVGGWGTESEVIEVRDAFIYEPFPIWNWVSNSEERARMEEFCKKSIIQEYEVCKDDPYEDPPGLAIRLKFIAAKKLYKKLEEHGYSGTELCLAFISEYKRLKIESLTFAHEGRHAIDQRFFPEEFQLMSSSEREFRAKLSEVAFSSNPQLAITGSILGSTLGSETDHGRANKRFRTIIVDWMMAHMREIEGIDKTKPMLPQFHLLSKNQIFEICTNVDPLAKAEKNSLKQ